MAVSAVTTTGLAEFQAAVTTFGPTLQRELQAVAERHGRRVQIAAQQKLGGALRKAIVITMHSEPAKHEVRVEATHTQAYPTSIALWFEYGTAGRRQKKGRYTGRIEPRRYMTDSVMGAEAAYRSELSAVAERVAREAFTA